MFLRLGAPESQAPSLCGLPHPGALRLLRPVVRVHLHEAAPGDLDGLEGVVELRGAGRGGPYFDLDERSFQIMQDRLPHWADRVDEAARLQEPPGPSRPWDSLDFRSRPSLMGILNITPDSFSDGGAHLDPRAALDRATEMLDEGAEIIDLGGESTRPGSSGTDAATELERVLPVLRDVRSLTDRMLSIDTMKPEVARKALGAGADMINDVSGLRDPGMRALAAEADVPVVIMHMRGTPRDMQEGIHFDDVVREVVDELKAMADRALDAGVRRERIILDPGIGFGKTARDNLEIVKRLRELRCLGYPIMVGASRKSFIGRALDTGAEGRLEGSLAVASECMRNGVDILRVHDVKETLRALRMTDALRTLTI